MEEAEKGWRIMVGGKLGRHPQLGRQLEGIHSKEEVLAIVEHCLDVYFAHNVAGERFGAILNRIGYDFFLCNLPPRKTGKGPFQDGLIFRRKNPASAI
jgi:dissimilatory sulfite reductase (desulfoviridin) alpha/beta subunit